MGDYLQQALMLLGVGMVTVFIILWIVVLVGNGIILFVNRFIPLKEEASMKRTGLSHQMEATRLAAITAAVQIATQGQGRIISIEKKQ
jgi:oxaloacetate decarboxylase gamma subunit